MKLTKSKDSRAPFHSVVLDWFRNCGREFPWRSTSNAYHILVAEVLLRQTQANRVLAPYLELIEQYPSPSALAGAEPSELSQWFRPLGLFQRSERLIEASRVMVKQHGGCVPADLNALMSLPGIGTYSARAILSLAFRMPVPMVDESSGRLYRRLWGLQANGPAYNDRTLLGLVEDSVPKIQSREFNLGVLDIAAAHCHVRNPKCVDCPLATYCTYRETVAIGKATAENYSV